MIACRCKGPDIVDGREQNTRLVVRLTRIEEAYDSDFTQLWRQRSIGRDCWNQEREGIAHPERQPLRGHRAGQHAILARHQIRELPLGH